VTFHVNNPLGALDHALHGREGLRGWGEHAMPERTLLLVRGFDPATNRYRYDVNPRFGSTNPQFSAFRQPVSLTLSVRVDVGPSREQQTIIRELDQGRRTPGTRVSEAVLQGRYGSGGVINPMAQLLRQGDSLRLTGRQADSIASMNVRYLATLDSIWRRTTAHLAALPQDYNRGEAYSVYRRAREASVDLLLELAPRVTALLTDEQRRSLPLLVASHLDRRYLQGIRSGTIGDSGAGVFSNTNTGTSGGVTVRRTNIITSGAP